MDVACFATHSSYGILDLGASKTVIGSQHVPELIQSLCPELRFQLMRCPCHVAFKFGNEGTLSSTQALVIPIGPFQLRVAVVPGGTPLLLSNTLMRVLRVQVDCHQKRRTSSLIQNSIPLQLTSRGLFLVDLNLLANAFQELKLSDISVRMQGSTQTFVSEGSEQKSSSGTSEKLVSEAMKTPVSSQHSINRSDLPQSTLQQPESNQFASDSSAQPPCNLMCRKPSNVTQQFDSIPTDCASPESPVKRHVAEQPSEPGDRSPGSSPFQRDRGDDTEEPSTENHHVREEVWQDKEWVKFMVSRFSKSAKEAHQKFIKYVELRVAELEQAQNQGPVIPRRQGRQGSGHAPPTAKAKAASKAASAPSPGFSWQMEGAVEDDSESEMYAPQTMTSSLDQSEMMDALQQRVLHMENALTRIIHHLEEQHQVTEPH